MQPLGGDTGRFNVGRCAEATHATTAENAVTADTSNDGLTSATGTPPLNLTLSAKALTGSVDVMFGAHGGPPPQAHDGLAGAVPQPLVADASKFLRGDASWQNPPVSVLSGTGEQYHVLVNSEEITLDTGGASFTDSVSDLLPADSVILGIVATVTDAIVGPVNFTVGDGSVANRFVAVGPGATLGAKVVGTKHRDGTNPTAAGGPRQAAAAKVRITNDGGLSAISGKVRVVVFAEVFA